MIFTPHPYQKLIGDFVFNHDRCNVWAGMGLGKTSETIAIFAALPAPRPGHLRVIRVEGKCTASTLSVRLQWNALPNPYNDSPRHSLMSEEVCAAHPHTFHEWFPEWAHKWFAELGLRVVALDVPDEHAVVQEMQVCIRREHAVTVAVLH